MARSKTKSAEVEPLAGQPPTTDPIRGVGPGPVPFPPAVQDTRSDQSTKVTGTVGKP